MHFHICNINPLGFTKRRYVYDKSFQLPLTDNWQRRRLDSEIVSKSGNR